MIKQAALALLCATLFAAGVGTAVADPAFDRDMASRYMQAAQSGDDDAEFYLGALYSAGVGLPASDGEAFRWFSRAAEQGHSHAMLILAGLYAIGRGTEKDNVKAYKWAYVVASASKVDEFRNGARQLMGVLETRMTSEEVNLAIANATSWHAAPAAGQTMPDAPIAGPSSPAPPTTANAPVAPGSASPQPAQQAPQAQPSPAMTILPSPAPKAGSGPDLRFGKAPRKEDVDNLLDQVPQGLRKRFGF